MRNIWTIAKREYDNYFNNPLAYIVGLVMFLVIGVFFAIIMLGSSQQALFGGPAPDSRNITFLFVFLMVFLSPALTMRLVSDEARMGTLELMLTAPLRDFELIAGKWLGAMLFILLMALGTLFFPMVMTNYVDPGLDWKLVISSYIGLLLICSALVGLGVGISAMFSNQFAAFFATFGLFFIMYFMIGIAGGIIQNPDIANVLNHLDISNHFTAMNNGSIELKGVVYYISLTALGLFTGTTAIEIRRWQ